MSSDKPTIQEINTQAIQIVELNDNMTDREKAFTVLKANGFNSKQAYELAGGKKVHAESTPYVMDRKIKTKSLVSPKLKKLAHLAVEETLRMQPVDIERVVVTKEGNQVRVQDKLYPSHSNRLTAAQLIIDRDEPAIQKHLNMNINAGDVADLVDLQAYRDAPEDDDVPKDVEIRDVSNDSCKDRDANLSQNTSNPA